MAALTTTDLLRALRERGLTQMEISRRTAIPQYRLSRWASGQVPTGADDSLRLLELYHQTAPAAAQQPAG